MISIVNQWELFFRTDYTMTGWAKSDDILARVLTRVLVYDRLCALGRKCEGAPLRMVVVHLSVLKRVNISTTSKKKKNRKKIERKGKTLRVLSGEGNTIFQSALVVATRREVRGGGRAAPVRNARRGVRSCSRPNDLVFPRTSPHPRVNAPRRTYRPGLLITGFKSVVSLIIGLYVLTVGLPPSPPVHRPNVGASLPQPELDSDRRRRRALLLFDNASRGYFYNYFRFCKTILKYSKRIQARSH